MRCLLYDVLNPDLSTLLREHILIPSAHCTYVLYYVHAGCVPQSLL